METRNNCPNLDCLSDEGLENFILARGNCMRPIKFARSLFPDMPRNYVVTACNLGHYAWNLKVARSCRERGDILTAQSYEDICENIYQRLPQWARW